MQTISVDMESRACVNCGRQFRVLVKSSQKVCSTQCEYFTQAHGARPKQSPVSEKVRASVNVTFTEPKHTVELGAKLTQMLAQTPTRRGLKPSKPVVGSGITQTRREPVQNVSNGAERIESSKTKSLAAVIETEDKSVSIELPPTKIERTRPESSDELSPSIELESLEILALSKSSAKRLHRLMKAAVSNRDLNDQVKDLKRVNIDNIETAIRCANAITNIVQTNINLMKALNGK